MEQTAETAITEITIQPDGRIYVFGASSSVLALLRDICPNDSRLLNRLASTATSAEDRLAQSYISMPAGH